MNLSTKHTVLASELIDESSEEWGINMVECDVVHNDDSQTDDIVLSSASDDEPTGQQAESKPVFIDSETDAKKISDMFGDGSTEVTSCCGNECNRRIPKELALRHRCGIQELTKREKDLVIAAQLQAHRRIPQLVPHYGQSTRRKKSRLKESHTLLRQDVRYFFYDLPICKKMYCFLNDVGLCQLENIRKHLDKNGIAKRVHQLAHKRPTRKNVLQPEDVQKIVSFLQSFGKQFGLPKSDTLPQFRDFNISLLPRQHTKASIYRKYCESLSEEDKRIAQSTFYKTWKNYCPYIAVTTNESCNKAV